MAARSGHKEISPYDLDEAADRVVMGPERRSRVISPREKRITRLSRGGGTL